MIIDALYGLVHLLNYSLIFRVEKIVPVSSIQKRRSFGWKDGRELKLLKIFVFIHSSTLRLYLCRYNILTFIPYILSVGWLLAAAAQLNWTFTCVSFYRSGRVLQLCRCYVVLYYVALSFACFIVSKGEGLAGDVWA